MAADLCEVLEEIDAVLRERPGRGADAVTRIESTLTDGYARALALEGEQLRLQRRLGELARALTPTSAGENVEELSTLGDRIAALESDLRLLRGRLAELKRRASTLRPG